MIPFNSPHIIGKELYNIAKAHVNGSLSGDGHFTKICSEHIQQKFDIKKVLLTHSCTAALEMQSLLLHIKEGDEVIMPSYTFVSTANAVALRGGVPVFVDIREDTLNIDERLIEDAITSKTRAIAPVHYAGVACEMDTIMDIANRHGLKVIEDAAQGYMATYKGKALGTIGHLGAYSFHETKNVISGEGGALCINDPEYIQLAEILREKGTDRSRFIRGEVDKYTWQEVGSSYLPGEIIAAFLWAQLEHAEDLTHRRLQHWHLYHELLEPLERMGRLRRPVVPEHCVHNAHMYYILLPTAELRNNVMQALKTEHIHAVFHYVPLHSAPAAQKYARVHGALKNTDELSARLLRLPMFYELSDEEICRVVEVLKSVK